jgi:CRISPR-associated protein Cmr2
MNEAILIFSLGPVQGFIAEARRVGDLDAGSEALKRLSRAAGRAIQDQGGTLIYPAHLEEDVPNKLVARAPDKRVEAIAETAQEAVQEEWREHANAARRALAKYDPPPDDFWEAIWERQTTTFWETYWAAAPLDGGYEAAYDKANRAFDATKRTRVFPKVEEQDLKDSLSGQRSALRTADLRADEYWAQVAASSEVTQAQLRPQGRERLDALGAVKRWGGLADKSPSVSHVAATDFLTAAQEHSKELKAYRSTIENLMHNRLYRVSDDPVWPYDGDLFFEETLTENRLADSYGLTQPQPGLLEAARETLTKTLYPVVGHPSHYYAVIVFDGDGVGKMVSKCETEATHRAFSQRLLDFAKTARGLILEQAAHPVYVGGDDVLALSPLSKALPLAQTLAEQFKSTVKGTASAGVALAHHLHPLDATLIAARAAEGRAKNIEGKASVCVRTLRRSGEQFDVRSRWDNLGDFELLISFFRDGALSSKLPYAVAESAYAFSDPSAAFEAELKRLLKRHCDPKKWSENEATEWAARLRTWAEGLPGPAKQQAADPLQKTSHAEELARWLALARFLAQGGVK